MLLLAIALLAWGASAVDYRYEFAVVWDGTAAANRGVVQLSSTDEEFAAEWIRDNIANDGFENANDYQMDLFRDAALEFFSERFGVVPKDPFLPDFDGRIMVSNDSYIMPMVKDKEHNGRVSVFRRATDTRYLPEAFAYEGGYYLIVGDAGLPAGGTYGMPLKAGMMSGFGQIIVEGICPIARNLVTFECTGRGGLIGELRIDFQNDIPIEPMVDQGWSAAETGAPAQVYPIMMSLRQRDKDSSVNWGSGSCTGMFYATPKGRERFNILSNMVCNFGPSANYNGFV